MSDARATTRVARFRYFFVKVDKGSLRLCRRKVMIIWQLYPTFVHIGHAMVHRVGRSIYTKFCVWGRYVLRRVQHPRNATGVHTSTVPYVDNMRPEPTNEGISGGDVGTTPR